MAFKNGLTEHPDEIQLASPRSPQSESPFSGYPSPPASQTAFNTVLQSPVPDIRSNLQRRFTTDSTKFSPWMGFNSQAPPLPEQPLDLISSATHIHKSQLFEKKRQHIEYMREQRKRFEADLKLLEIQQEKETKEMDEILKDLTKDLSKTSLGGPGGPVSEPTTPPEHRGNGFPNALSRPARFSMSSTMPAGSNVSSLYSSQVSTPPSSQIRSTIGSSSHTPSASESLMESRRGSSQDISHSNAFTAQPPRHMPRYSLPTSTLGTALNGTIANNKSFYDFLGSTKRIVEDENQEKTKDDERIATPDVHSYLKLTDMDDKFPTLTRREDNSGLLSANNAALNLVNPRMTAPETYSVASRHSAHQSLPQNSLNWLTLDGHLERAGAAVTSSVSSGSNVAVRHTSHLSLETPFPSFTTASTQGLHQTTTTSAHSRPASLQFSYSANDVATVHNGVGFRNVITPPKSQVDQVQSVHTMSGAAYGVPVVNGSQIINRTTPPTPQSDQEDRFGPISPQAVFTSAMSFPAQTTSVNIQANTNENIATGLNGYHNPYYGYAIQPITGGPLPGAGNQMPPFSPQASFTPYGSGYPAYPRFNEGPRTATQNRRSGETDSSPFSRFSNVPLETYRGEFYGLCKDQHGCRYLQRKLEERNPESVKMIFLETNMHVVELMTDPFGNYLCQKLLEYSNDEQRTTLIKNAAPQLVQIAFNQHGTRALQKMIEFLSTHEQIKIVVNALRDKVVELVQDLNGNHVIQKCLNRLTAPDAQFIFDAVGASCIVVGTHRHGCCVLQRCIDHASGDQRARLIAQITENSFSLVQDPFGNYVVQYILDLSEPRFTEPLCQTFRGNVPALSKQKFSSNVIEKCIRKADFPMRRLFIQEMLAGSELEKMLRDSFANYVVQTAIDFADPESRTTLMDAIRPILPAIRQTPHGRRIAGKMVSIDAQSRTNDPNSNLVDENAAYQTARGLPVPHFAPRFNFPEHMVAQLSTIAANTEPAAPESATTAPADDATTVIYSPIPQHGNHAINGLNGVTPPTFPLF